MIKKALAFAFPPFPDARVSTGLLVLRVLTGVGIAMHGYGKLGHIGGFAEGMNIPYAVAAMAVFTEFLGGIAIAAGILTPIVALMLVGNMTVAALHHITAGDPFLLAPKNGAYGVGWEFASLYLVSFFAILMAGPGKFSLDFTIFGGKR